MAIPMGIPRPTAIMIITVQWPDQSTFNTLSELPKHSITYDNKKRTYYFHGSAHIWNCWCRL